MQASGIKAGLANIRVLLDHEGNPHRSFPCVHVAGTNGKGSVSSMIAAVLSASGLRTGLYTSPHLVDFTERIRIDGRKIPARRVSEYIRELRPAIRRTGATFFEATTAIAFRYFADRRVDIAVVETGLGGRWDSTNVVTPLVSVITSIGLEHQEYLGNTIGKIAFEKAGIIKRGVPCVVGDIRGPAIGVIGRSARRTGSRLIRAFSGTAVETTDAGLDGMTADVVVGRRRFRGLRIGAAGSYQAGNARIALQTIEILRRLPAARLDTAISDETIRRGMASPGELTGFAGRLQVLSRQPLIIADVAHNPDGIRSLAGALRTLFTGKFRIVFGVVQDKDFGSMLAELAPLSRMIYFVRAETPRSRAADELLEFAHDCAIPARMGGSVSDGIRLAIAETGGSDPILITGSHFVVGEAMQTLGIRI